MARAARVLLPSRARQWRGRRAQALRMLQQGAELRRLGGVGGVGGVGGGGGVGLVGVATVVVEVIDVEGPDGLVRLLEQSLALG